MFLKAREKYDIDMAASVSVGDQERDVIAGQRAGVGKNLLFSGDFMSLISKISDCC
jgi:histidinol phosphatase-like enzyme